MKRAVLLIIALAAPHSAAAQTIQLTATDPASWDVSFSAGWLGGNKSGLAQEWDDWYDVAAASCDIGYYWTRHLKTEATFTATNTGSVYSHDLVAIPGQRGPILVPREHRFRVNAASLGASYQFLDNAWVHPYVGAGVQAQWERHRIETEPATTDVRVRPFLTTGAKFYMTEQAFLRSDVSAAFDARGATHVMWRAGIGFDF